MTDLVETVGLDQVEKALFKHMNELRLENLLCDVRFNVNGTIIPCHRLVLSAMSPYFKTMFNGNFEESKSDTVTMNDIETETFEEILNAMYTASISFHAGNAYFILKASHLFQLEIIENACLSYIIRNLEINFLVETCIFAQQNIWNDQYKSLCFKCSRAISISIIEYGKIDSFSKIPFDRFKNILYNYPRVLNESQEELVILLIKKWSKQNNASCKDIEILLDAAHLKSTKLINSSLMSRLLVCSDDKFMMNDAHSEGTQELHCDDSNLPVNLYLNAINVVTGQRGWGVLKLNGGLDKYFWSSFHPSRACSKKVCRIGSKLYCFEISAQDDKEANFFSYDEKDDIRSALPTPSDLIIDQFEITAVKTSVYLMITKPHFLIWLYNCETNTWQNVLRKNEHENIYCNVSACTFSSGCFYVLAQKEQSALFANLFSITPSSTTFIVKEIVGLSLISGNISYLRAFDSKIAIYTVYGTKHVEKMNALKIFNLNKRPKDHQWLSFLTAKESRHVNFFFLHYNGSMYFVENGRAMIPNQKYNLSSDSWINLPFLPEQITIPNTNQVLATGEVFGCDVNP